MVVKINSFGLMGMDSYPVEVEGAINKGFPAFDMVGLPDAAVKESRDRVKSAMKNCGFNFPTAHITINLAPADIKKEGPIYDLPILIAVLMIPQPCCPSIGKRSPNTPLLRPPLMRFSKTDTTKTN